MDPREFLNLAQQLAQATTEAAWRSAISRAYYAAFHVARELLEIWDSLYPMRIERTGISGCGCRMLATLKSNWLANLNSMRRDRNWADYELARPIRQTVIQRQLLAAALIIQRLDTAAIDPTRTVITDAMKIYERDVLHDVTWHP